MVNISKEFTLILILLLAASSLTVVSTVSGQSLKPVVTEFSLQYVDNSYDVPPSNKYTKDLYTGETITTTTPGYHVDNKSIVATIKNPSGVDAYNFRWKPHNEILWHYAPFDTETDQTSRLRAYDAYGISGYASNSEYTVFTLTFILKSVTSVDVQVQALYGDYRAIPYGGLPRPGGPTYDFYFDGQASYWSDTKTVTINGSAAQNTPTPPTPTPTVTSFPPTPIATSTGTSFGFDLMQTAVVVLAVAVVILVAVIILVFRNYRKAK